MPKRVKTLSDAAINKAKPKDKEHHLYDGDGLYIAITPTGGKLWRMKYYFEGKERRIHFGSYPEISLADARQRRFEARQLLVKGIDPGAVKKAMKEARNADAETFEVIAHEWHQKYINEWTSGHAVTIMSRLNRDIFPYIGSMPILNIKAADVLKVLRRVESRGALDTLKVG